MHGMWNLVLMIRVNRCHDCESFSKESRIGVVMFLTQSSAEMADIGSECESAM